MLLITPCYIFEELEFARGINGFRNALKTRFKRVSIGYSVKTNSLPYAMRLAHEFGCMAEVVSSDEYQLARLCGYGPAEIIYNGPMKSKETFMDAVTQGAVVNIEAKREIDWLKDLPQNKNYNVGLRLNINISHVSPTDADGDDDNSRFGFSDDSSEFREAIDSILKLRNIHLAGLHIHRTTHSRSPRFYEHSIEFAAGVIEKYNLKLDYIDIGGGYFGIFPNKPNFKDYADAIYKSLSKHNLENLNIIVEPGNALTASSFSFLSKVIDTKQVDSKTRFVTTDGSRNDIDPFFRKTDYLKEIHRSSNDRPIISRQIISGCTCLEYDRMFILTDEPELCEGDMIKYNNVGAYTMTLSPQFIRFWPAVYVQNADGEYKLIRRKTEAKDIIKLDIQDD